jgi:hypothetical protein
LAKLAVQRSSDTSWLIKVRFSASTFVLKIPTFAKAETVIANGRTTIQRLTNLKFKHRHKDKPF